MTYLIHYSKNIAIGRVIENPTLLEMMSDIWKFTEIEADSKDVAIEKLNKKEGKEKINYILSIEPITE